jgi:hypothetical protein
VRIFSEKTFSNQFTLECISNPWKYEVLSHCRNLFTERDTCEREVSSQITKSPNEVCFCWDGLFGRGAQGNLSFWLRNFWKQKYAQKKFSVIWVDRWQIFWGFLQAQKSTWDITNKRSRKMRNISSDRIKWSVIIQSKTTISIAKDRSERSQFRDSITFTSSAETTEIAVITRPNYQLLPHFRISKCFAGGATLAFLAHFQYWRFCFASWNIDHFTVVHFIPSDLCMLKREIWSLIFW